MMNTYRLSKREKEVAGLLLEGKSNKQIAAALHISDSTVEFHLTKLYTKLGVVSRAEAIIRLSQIGKTLRNGTDSKIGEIMGTLEGNSGKSIVVNIDGSANNKSAPIVLTQENLAMTHRTSRLFGRFKILITVGIILVPIAIVVFFLSVPKTWKKYERECEHPDAYTVGQTIARSNASGAAVHGQFGSTNVSPWLALAGYVTYKNISTPRVEQLYLKVRYSKNSPTTVSIFITVDNEKDPRASFTPKDQGGWNKFAWTEPIYLGNIKSGVHSLTYTTDGQQYGVADLDEFVLTAGPSP